VAPGVLVAGNVAHTRSRETFRGEDRERVDEHFSRRKGAEILKNRRPGRVLRPAAGEGGDRTAHTAHTGSTSRAHQVRTI